MEIPHKASKYIVLNRFRKTSDISKKSFTLHVTYVIFVRSIQVILHVTQKSDTDPGTWNPIRRKDSRAGDGANPKDELQLYIPQHADPAGHHGLLLFPAATSYPAEPGFPRHSDY